MWKRVQWVPKLIRFWCQWVVGLILGTASVLAAAADAAAGEPVIVRTGGELYRN